MRTGSTDERSMSVVCAFAASGSECRSLKRLMTIDNGTAQSGNIVTGKAGPNRVILVRTGMGPLKARSSASVALGALGTRGAQTSSLQSPIGNNGQTQHPQLAAVFVFGLAGSLSRSVAEGDVILYDRCLSADGQSPVMCSPRLTRKLTQMLRAGDVSCREVTGISGTRIASTRLEKQRLAQLDAEAVDMESYEVVAEANRRGVPAVVLRAVSDSFEREMPDFNGALNSEGEFNPLALARVCAARPLAAAALAATSWRAMRGIRKALDIIFSEGFPGERDTVPAQSRRVGSA
jgi:uridine phosphorylase